MTRSHISKDLTQSDADSHTRVEELFRRHDRAGQGTLKKAYFHSILAECRCGMEKEIGELLDHFQRVDASGAAQPDTDTVNYTNFFKWLWEGSDETSNANASREAAPTPSASADAQQATSAPSQAETIAALGPTLLEHGRVFKKVKRAFIRQAREGEFVQTILDGKVETEQAAKAGDWVVRADTRWQECYILPDAKFQNVYGSGGGIAIEGHAGAAELAAEGFLSYQPKARIRAVEATEEVLSKYIPGGCFIASWGAEMRVEAGDFLAAPVSPDGDVREVYRIERVAFGETYVSEGDA